MRSGNIRSRGAQTVPKRQERQSKHDVEGSVEIRDRARKIGFDLHELQPDPRKERQGHRRPDKARDDVSDRDAPTRGLAGPRAFEKRIERRADVRPNDQGHRGVEWHDAFLGEGHHKQHDCNARMRSPGQQRTERQRNQRIVAIPPMRMRRLGTSRRV